MRHERHSTRRRQPRCPMHGHGGFTLVEILIVVVILGILAAVVVPQFTNASITARENTMKDELRYLRTQIVVYKAQHRDVPPGPTAAEFEAQLTGYTDDQGNTAAARDDTFKFGPYLSKMPTNPLNGLATVLVVADASDLAPDDSTGWIYLADPIQIIANTTGADVNGTSYSQY